MNHEHQVAPLLVPDHVLGRASVLDMGDPQDLQLVERRAEEVERRVGIGRGRGVSRSGSTSCGVPPGQQVHTGGASYPTVLHCNLHPLSFLFISST
jgi:hypothetical protein